MSILRLAAVDLGASSGRVVTAEVGPDRLDVREAHRFDNGPVPVGHRDGATLYWDALGIYREVLHGLRVAGSPGALAGVGIDSWAVDYGLLARDGSLLGNPVSYRDRRTDGVMQRVLEKVSPRELYDITGLQQLPFNTLYQLVSALDTPALEAAETMLLVPDLIGYWLTGQVGAEATNASTTQLYDVRSRDWARPLAERLGIPTRILPPLREPGDVVGPVLPGVAGDAGLTARLPVIAVGSHDTASAVVGVPMESRQGAAYISSGTWSLVGVELETPVLTDPAMAANFTNEGGVDGTVRFLRNVSGLWLLSEAMRLWQLQGQPVELDRLLVEAAGVPEFRSVVDVEDAVFLPPGDMGARIREVCSATGQPLPRSQAEVARCVLEGLALAYRRTIREVAQLTGKAVDVVHVVGGGSRNALLCQLTADACGVPVLAGPVEAAAFGNALVQARSLGAPVEDLAAMRALIRRTQHLRCHTPSGSSHGWDDAEARLTRLRSGG
jgi:rhamnulokinase